MEVRTYILGMMPKKGFGNLNSALKYGLPQYLWLKISDVRVVTGCIELFHRQHEWLSNIRQSIIVVFCLARLNSLNCFAENMNDYTIPDDMSFSRDACQMGTGLLAASFQRPFLPRNYSWSAFPGIILNYWYLLGT